MYRLSKYSLWVAGLCVYPSLQTCTCPRGMQLCAQVHTPRRERPRVSNRRLLFRNRIHQINTGFSRRGRASLPGFLFLFLLACLPPMSLTESRKDGFHSCVLVGSHMSFTLGGIFKKMFVVWLPCLLHRDSGCGMLARRGSGPSCGRPRTAPGQALHPRPAQPLAPRLSPAGVNGHPMGMMPGHSLGRQGVTSQPWLP